MTIAEQRRPYDEAIRSTPPMSLIMTTRRLVLLSAFTAGLGLLGTASMAQQAPYKNMNAIQTITAKEAKKLLDERKDILLLDVREPDEYEQGHINGATNLPLSQIERGKLPDDILDKKEPVMVYCRSGRRSARAAALLEQQGYTAIYDMGGIISWPYGTVKGNH